MQFVEGWLAAFDMSEAECEAMFDSIDAQRTRDFEADSGTERQREGEVFANCRLLRSRREALLLSPRACHECSHPLTRGCGSPMRYGLWQVDILEFTNALPLSALGPLVTRCRHRGALYHAALDEAECAGLERLLARLNTLAARASALDVRLMIDAEHTYFQPAIDHAVLRLSREYNRERVCVYGTYQAYLLECADKLALDLARSHREGWHLGAKLVRGAYMVHERQRASELGYASPIQPTAEATHASYDAALDTLLLRCPSPERTSVMVATHNRASIERAAAYLLGGSGDDGAGGAGDGGAGGPPGRSRVPFTNVAFGQLLGMADHLTLTLARCRLRTYKYVPYGPVREVLPYLIRRGQENADALSGAREQRDMMLAEVRRRAVGW